MGQEYDYNLRPTFGRILDFSTDFRFWTYPRLSDVSDVVNPPLPQLEVPSHCSGHARMERLCPSESKAIQRPSEHVSRQKPVPE